jgi:Ca-activated chloride channel family protein
MTLLWPWMLVGLAAVPLLVRWYRRLLRDRTARRTALAALGLAAPEVSARRRVGPPALLLGALVLLLVGLARPEVGVPLPRREGTVIIAVDTSASMAATDLAPTRMDAAKAAAKEFVTRQPPSVRLGVVAFSGSGLVTQEVTDDRRSVVAAIDRLRPDGGTALGRGLQTSLTAIVGTPVLLDARGPTPGVEPQGPDLGYHGSAAVVLFTDGENTDRPDPLAVAEVASSAGVKVYPVGLGRPEGTVLQIEGFSLATALDEPMLREIAARTDGRYVAGADARALTGVADAVDVAWTVEIRRVEVTALLAAAAAALLLAAVGLSLAWSGRAL